MLRLQAEGAENFLVCTPLVTFWGTLVTNQKKMSNQFGGKNFPRRHFGAVAPCAPS